MAAYFVIELDVADGPKLAEYEREVTQHVVAAGGRFLVRGNNIRPIEGGWCPKRFVVVEFPDLDAVERYYHSEPNQRLKRTRLAGTGGAPARAFAVEGLPAPSGGREPEEVGVDDKGQVIWA